MLILGLLVHFSEALRQVKKRQIKVNFWIWGPITVYYNLHVPNFFSQKITPPYPIVMNKISLVEPLPPLLTWNSTSVSWLLETKLTQLKDPLLEQENCFRVWINYYLYFIESCKVINIDVFFHELISKKCPVCLGSAGRLDPAGAHLQVPAQHATHLH